MKTSFNGIELIKKHEGLRLRAYLCPGGVWTIGYGHTRLAREGMVITAPRAQELLVEDLSEAELCVLRQGLKINQNQFDALVSFVFNCGSGNFQRSTLLKKAKVNPQDPSIATEFRRWNKASGVVLAGLAARREDELKLYFS